MSIKKIITSAVVAGILGSALTLTASASYSDTTGTVYAESVNNLTMMNIVSGSDDGLFHPESNVTRAEFSKMIAAAFNTESMTFTQSDTGFTDVTADHWASGYISSAVTAGYINGYGNGLFGPDDHVTYNQAIKMIVSAMGYESDAQNMGGYPTGYVSYASTLNLTDGITKSGDEELTKGEIAIILNNAMEAPISIYSGSTVNVWGVPVKTYSVMDGTGSSFISPAIYYHDTYTLEGTFSNTNISSTSVKKGTIEFTIDYSRNFNGEYYPYGSSTPYIFNIDESADVNSIFLRYGTIHVKKDTSGEWWIVTAVI